MTISRVGAWLSIATTALFATTTSAEIYKSVDENGNVVFSQKAPKDTPSEVIKPRYSKPPTPLAGGGPMIAPNQPGGLPSASAASAPPDLSPEQLAANQKNCDTARDQLQQLQDPRVNRMQFENDRQERAFLTPELIAQRIEQAQDMIAKSCSTEGTETTSDP